MRIRFAAAELFRGMQPDDFRVCFREGADFLEALKLKRHQPHEFDRIACVAQPLLFVRFCGRTHRLPELTTIAKPAQARVPVLLQRGKVASGGAIPAGKGVLVTFMSMPSSV